MPQPATQTLSKAFTNAQQEARRLNQEFVGIEHLALALLDDDQSEAVRVLRQMNVESGYVRNALAHALPAGKEPPIITGDLPISPRAQRVIVSAIAAAQLAGRPEVSSRFVLSIILSEPGGVVCESFRRNGADVGELATALCERDVLPEN